jgi:hypothetical protein
MTISIPNLSLEPVVTLFPSSKTNGNNSPIYLSIYLSMFALTLTDLGDTLDD